MAFHDENGNGMWYEVFIGSGNASFKLMSICLRKSTGKKYLIIVLISKVVKNIKNFPTGGGSDKIKNFLSSKISQVREGGSENLGTFPKFYHVINYDGFP